MRLNMWSAVHQPTVKPSLATLMAGAMTSPRLMVPYRSSASVRPATVPGVVHALCPTTLASSFTLYQPIHPGSVTSSTSYMSGVQFTDGLPT